MSFELTARTEAGATLVALAESLADDFAERASCHDRDASCPFESIESLKRCGYFAAPVPTHLGGLGGYLNGSLLARAYRDVRAGAFMHPLGANRAYELIGQVALGLEPALH